MTVSSTAAANVTKFTLGERGARRINDGWKGNFIADASAAAFQYGMLVSANMLPLDRAKSLLKFNFEQRKVDDKYWSTVNETFLSGRASDTTYAELRDRMMPVVANDNQLFEPSPFVWRDPKAIPPRDWIYGRHLLRRHVSATIASGAVGKTSLKIVEALALATGRNLLGYDVPKPARVWLFNLEDDRDEIDRRVTAAMIHYKITPEDTAGRLFVEGETPLIITETDRQGTKIRQPVVDGLIDAIKRRSIDVMIVDPFVSSHDAPESDNGAIDKIVKHGWVKVAREGGCAIDISHHVTKADANGGMATAMSARGAGSFIAACRSVQVLNPMQPEEASKAGLASHVGYFSCYGDKQNLTPKTNFRDWYKMESVDLGNAGDGNLAFLKADNIGVVTRWQWPTDSSFVEDVTPDQLRAVTNLLKIGEHRKDVQSNDWAGYKVGKVLCLGETKDTMGVQDRQRIKRMLETWVKNGVLKERTSKIDGHQRTFLTVP